LLDQVSHELEHKGDLPPDLGLLSSIILVEGGARPSPRRWYHVNLFWNPIFNRVVVHIIEAIGKDRPHLALVVLITVFLDGVDALAEDKVVRNPLMNFLDAHGCAYCGLHLQNENLSMLLFEVFRIITIEEDPITHDRYLITDLFSFIYPMRDDESRSLSEPLQIRIEVFTWYWINAIGHFIHEDELWSFH
jgi:hypothetical protein